MITPYLISFLASLALIAVWHGLVWRSRGKVASIHKFAGNALKAFVWACNAILYYYDTAPGLFRLGEAWALTVGPAILSAFVFQACVWWLAFDILVNVIGGRPVFHLGETALTDRPFSSYAEKLVVQVVCIAVAAMLMVFADSMI